MVGMATFVNEAEDVKLVALDSIINQERERAATAAGKAMRADMIAAATLEDHADVLLHPLMKLVPQPR